MSNYKNCTEISIETKCAMTQSYFIRKPFVYNRDNIIIRLTLFYEPSIPLFDASYCTCRFWIASKFNFENEYSLLFYAETGKLLRDELFKWAKYTSLRWTINKIGQQRQLVPVKAAAWFVWRPAIRPESGSVLSWKHAGCRHGNPRKKRPTFGTVKLISEFVSFVIHVNSSYLTVLWRKKWHLYSQDRRTFDNKINRFAKHKNLRISIKSHKNSSSVYARSWGEK